MGEKQLLMKEWESVTQLFKKKIEGERRKTLPRRGSGAVRSKREAGTTRRKKNRTEKLTQPNEEEFSGK